MGKLGITDANLNKLRGTAGLKKLVCAVRLLHQIM